MSETRTEQDRELELSIFGYVDEFPPIPGSFKANALELANEARALGIDDNEIVEPLRATAKRMAERRDVFIETLLGRALGMVKGE